MGLAKIFDSDSRTISLINILDEAINNPTVLCPDCSLEEIVKLKGTILKHRDTLNNIKGLRDQYLAHRDKEPRSKPKITIGEIDELSKTVQEVFNGLSSAHDKNIYSWSFQEKRSSRITTEIFRVLEGEIAQHKEKLARLAKDTRN